MSSFPHSRARRSSSSRLLLPVAAIVALGVGSSTATAQESVDAVVLEPCREPCGLTLVPEREYGADSGEGMIEAEMAIGRLDASGRAYVIAGWSTPHVWVFGADGSLLSRIGRFGSGPGEFGDIGSIVVTEDGVFAVLDRGRGAIMTFDWTGELLRDVRTENWWPLGIQTVPLEGSLVLHVADIPTPAQAGYPVHVVDLESGAIRESFGSLTGEYELGTRLRRLTIARGPGRSVWMAPVWGSYQVELWESNTLVRVLRRDVEWFPPDQMEGHGWEDKPDPAVVSIASDDSLLWVMAFTADERWAEAGATRDWDLFRDTRIEVIDWRRRRVLASERFDGHYDGWVEPGLTGNLVVTPTGSVRYVTYRVQLEEGSQDGAGPG